MSSSNRFAGDQGRKARWRNSARLNIMLLQGPSPQSALLDARERRFCVSYPWRAVGVGPCRGGVPGPSLAASRRDHHVPLGASPSRFLPVAIALLAAPPPRPPSRADRADLEGSVVATGCASFTHVCHEPPPHPFHPLFTDPCPALLSPLVWYHRSGEQ
jgi:hypothetical protein